MCSLYLCVKLTIFDSLSTAAPVVSRRVVALIAKYSVAQSSSFWVVLADLMFAKAIDSNHFRACLSANRGLRGYVNRGLPCHFVV